MSEKEPLSPAERKEIAEETKKLENKIIEPKKSAYILRTLVLTIFTLLAFFLATSAFAIGTIVAERTNVNINRCDDAWAVMETWETVEAIVAVYNVREVVRPFGEIAFVTDYVHTIKARYNENAFTMSRTTNRRKEILPVEVGDSVVVMYDPDNTRSFYMHIGDFVVPE
jgi:hypothetical protein